MKNQKTISLVALLVSLYFIFNTKENLSETTIKPSIISPEKIPDLTIKKQDQSSQFKKVSRKKILLNTKQIKERNKSKKENNLKYEFRWDPHENLQDRLYSIQANKFAEYLEVFTERNTVKLGDHGS